MCVRAGSWQHYIAEAIANFNLYCTIIFRRHLVYQSTKRKSRTNKLFCANGFCKHETCGAKNVQLTLKTNLTFQLIFNGTNIKHQVGIKAQKPIRGKQREIEKKLSHVSASLEYAERINEKPDGVFVAGNRDNIGNSAPTLRQISYEGKIGDLLSSGNFDGLIRLKNKYLESDKNKGEVKCFIRNISVYPVVPFLWTKGTFVVSFLQPLIRSLKSVYKVLE